VASWYYVDMKSEQPCFTGTLPKPGKKLIGKKIEYYVEAQNKTFQPARTEQFDPIVVKSAQECKKNVPVAPFLNNATVAVFPSVPAGFVGGGIGTAAVVGIVGAGAAVAGTTAVVVSNNNDTTTTTLAVVINPTTTTTTTLAPSTTTTTLAPGTNKAPFAVLKVSPDPPVGLTPLTVTFDLCSSTDADGDALSFFHDFGDGSKASGCIATHTYTAVSFQGPGASTAEVGIRSTSYSYNGSVVDTSGASQSRERLVTVNVPTPTTTTTSTTSTTTTTTSTTTTTTTTTLPPSFTLNLTKTGDTANGGVVDDTGQIKCGFGCTSGSGTYASGTTVTLTANSAFGFVVWTWSGSPPVGCAPAQTSCAITLTANQDVTVDFQNLGFRDGTTAANLQWRSTVQMEKAELQVIANGTTRVVVREGEMAGLLALADGENRIEATVVRAAGKAGQWRFDLAGAVRPGSLRVVAGDVVLVTDSEIVFRLQGKTGERVVFAFKSQ
jgi:hypothetical protein